MILGKSLARVQFSLGLLFLFTLLSVNGLGQSSASISGLVKDQNEAVVAGATVVAGNKGNGTETTVTTDSNGKYEFKNLTAGQYFIKVKKGGFSENAESVLLGSGENATQNFTISPGGLREEVTVTAAKGLRATSEIPQTVTTVSESEIEQRSSGRYFGSIRKIAQHSFYRHQCFSCAPANSRITIQPNFGDS